MSAAVRIQNADAAAAPGNAGVVCLVLQVQELRPRSTDRTRAHLGRRPLQHPAIIVGKRRAFAGCCILVLSGCAVDHFCARRLGSSRLPSPVRTLFCPSCPEG